MYFLADALRPGIFLSVNLVAYFRENIFLKERVYCFPFSISLIVFPLLGVGRCVYLWIFVINIFINVLCTYSPAFTL